MNGCSYSRSWEDNTKAVEVTRKAPLLLLSVTVNGKVSKAYNYKSVPACNTDITDCLKANSTAKKTLILEYGKEEWINIIATPTQQKLIAILNIFMVTSVACLQILFFIVPLDMNVCVGFPLRNYCNVYSSSFLIVYGT